ncbi:MAG TPA: TetR/AcrR family transcriptional regulator [Noviherbaspirillum sp.]|uniref:TetR/AcrR family transcriptional regulator n=1 Tax=Noviherbaspirillum sp. TaxID=1926288 RepID=UPI002D6D073A|nr:TetR/AcrR family transcriptional regulator [Noviherbaspirillum sp.]HYD94970.1 TetR/AcrR family transcriptional regulator [Noviherbaspirillum sp.]
MAPRPYNSTVRKDAEAETLRRIIAATVALHAEKGAMATSHAEIAARAGVSVPTVYKHFPTRNDLLPHCIGEVAGAAPVLDREAILAAPDTGMRLACLVDALHARYQYFHPWSRWMAVDAPFLPELARIAEEGAQELESLVKAVLADLYPRGIPQAVLALAIVILDYGTWQQLHQRLGKPRAVSRAALLALQRIVSSSPESE